MKYRKIRVSLGFMALFLLFLFIMDYPFLARLINSHTQGEVVVDYHASVEGLENSKKEQELAAARQYNEQLASGLGMKPESGADSEDEEYQEYLSILNSAGDSVIGTVEIPKIHVNLMICHGTSQEALEQGAGHLYGSSFPIGGAGTHACLSAHRGLVGKTMFTNLDELEEGDKFLLHILDETLCYRVEKIYTILPDEVETLEIRRGEDLVTLITCTPYGINTHRLCVEGHRIPYTEETKEEIVKEEERLRIRDWWWLGVSAVLVVFMIILVVKYNMADE